VSSNHIHCDSGLSQGVLWNWFKNFDSLAIEIPNMFRWRAISNFLYMSVTGLTIRHVGEHFHAQMRLYQVRIIGCYGETMDKFINCIQILPTHAFYISSHLSTQNMSIYHPLMILSHPRSVTIPNFGLISKMPSAQSMEVISTDAPL